MVINTLVKVASFNPLFVVISIVKIFPNTVFIFIFNYWNYRGFSSMCTKLIFISISKFALNCYWCLLKRGCIASQYGASII